MGGRTTHHMRTVHPPYARRQRRGDPFGSLEAGDVNAGVGTSGAKKKKKNQKKHEHTHATQGAATLPIELEAFGVPHRLRLFFTKGG